MELRRRRVRAPRGMWGSVSAAALLVWLAGALPAWAQDNVIGTATLPRDLSPWGMFLNADPVVKAVLVGLAFASLVTWTVWLAKSIEIFFAKRRVRAAAKELAAIPAVVIYNMFARSIAGYRAGLGDAAAEVLRLVSRDLERAAAVPAERALTDPVIARRVRLADAGAAPRGSP